MHNTCGMRVKSAEPSNNPQTKYGAIEPLLIGAEA